jgi:hypothetical protein
LPAVKPRQGDVVSCEQPDILIEDDCESIGASPARGHPD